MFKQSRPSTIDEATELIAKIEDFIDVIDGEEVVPSAQSQYKRWVVKRDWWDSDVGILIKSREDEPVTLSLYSRDGTGIGPIEAPINLWTVNQLIDDGHLVTALELDSSVPVDAGIDIYGPRVEGRHSGTTDLQLDGADKEDYLIAPENQIY